MVTGTLTLPVCMRLRSSSAMLVVERSTGIRRGTLLRLKVKSCSYSADRPAVVLNVRGAG